MYLAEILWLASWPVFIYIAYRVVFWGVKKFEKKFD